MPHAETYTEFTPDKYPPFPDGEFKTVPLQTISLKKLQDHDSAEEDRLFEACKTRGFFYLELPGCKEGDVLQKEADDIARVAERTFAMPLEEKKNFSMGGKELFGYKIKGQTRVDKNKTPDTAEFFNISKNDMIISDNEMRRQWPRIILENKPLFADYSKTAHSTGLLILTILAQKLGIDPEELRNRHILESSAGDHIRLTRGPPRETAEMPEIQTPSHTDFGSITLLKNWLGGLQVWSSSSRSLGALEPDTEGEWLWVKPQPNTLIVNLGDAAVKFTNGVLCSGRHRVVPSPGEQGTWPRYSIVYFVRPNDECKLKTLKGHGVPPAEDQEEEGVNAKEWIFRQSEALRGRAGEN